MSTHNDTEAVHQKLRAALQYSTGDPASDEMMRETIRAGVVRDDFELMNIFEQEVGPEQAEVDLHLDGPGVQGHSTNAKQFSDFISGISEAVKQTAKYRSGKERYSEDLLIEGATPGSVRVVLKVPPRAVTPGQTVDTETSASTVDSEALRSIASILTHASDPDPESPLIAEVADLPPQARTGLLRAIRTTREAGWTVSGTVKQRKVGLQQVQLSSAGATRLSIELKSSVDKVTFETATGKIDGFRRSLGSLYFIPDGRPPVIANVIDSTLASKVTALFGDPDLEVRVRFKVTESHLPGDAKQTRKTRTLEMIERVEAQGDLFFSD